MGIKNKDGKYLFGVCKVGERGQIVIPKEARDVFKIDAGDSLLMFGDINQGLALVKAEVFSDYTDKMFDKEHKNDWNKWTYKKVWRFSCNG